MSDDLVGRGGATAPRRANRPIGAKLLDDVDAFAGRFLAFPSEHCLTVVVLWAVHTWAVGSFYVTPRLVLDSPEPGSGKTRVLEVLALLSRSAKLTLSTTTAALYRRIAAAGDEPPTVLQDEADALFGKTANPAAEDLRALFNAGYKRGATVDRCEIVAKRVEVREFPVFAPLALAGLAGKMPATITDRAITIHMRRRAPDEEVDEFRERDADTGAAPLRARMEDWAAANADALAASRPTMPDGVRDRPAEVWEALLAIADVADPGGEWPARARAACRHFVLDADPDALSFGARLLRDVRTAFGDNDRMFSQDLVAELISGDESEWADLWGKPLDQRRLAKELKRYGVVPAKIRIGDAQGRGYLTDSPTGLAQAWRRYLADMTDPAGDRTSRTERNTAAQSNSHPYHDRTERTKTVPTERADELQLSGIGTAGTDGTHPDERNNVTEIPTFNPHRRKRTRGMFTPPAGPGRCPDCGWHIESQGHADDCTAANEKGAS